MKKILPMTIVLFTSLTFSQMKEMKIPQGTEVSLLFMAPLDSRTSKVGQVVKFQVEKDVKVDNKTIIRRGTRVSGEIIKVDGHQKYGINAQMRISFPKGVKGVNGEWLPLEARMEGKKTGSRTDKAALATGGGLVLLGPLGLIGGYFVDGKRVIVKKGDRLVTEISQDVTFRP